MKGGIKSLATLPPTDVLRGQLVSAVSGPLMTVVGLFAAPLRDLVNVIDARIKQLEEQGEAAPEPEPEPEAEAEAEPQAAAEEAAAEEVSPDAPAAEAATEEPETSEEAETDQED